MSQSSVPAPASAPESSLTSRVRPSNLVAYFDKLWQLAPAPGSERDDYEDWLSTFCKAVVSRVVIAFH